MLNKYPENVKSDDGLLPSVTIYSDSDLRRALERGEMEIEPFDPDNLTPNGYDLEIAEVVLPDEGTSWREGVARVPGQTRFLVSTRERVRLGPGIAGQLWLRSTWARRGVLASFGKVDAGFDGQLTLGAFNASKGDLEVPMGETFAQLVLEAMATSAKGLYAERSGHYQHQRGVTTEGRNPDGSTDVTAPCLEEGCTLCCQETEMPLTGGDVDRLAALGHDPGAFSKLDDGGYKRLGNVQGRCFFLGDDGRCREYDARPEGCRLYPLVFGEETGEAVLDEICPHTESARVPEVGARRLLAVLARVEAERARSTAGGQQKF
jgi:dCTP deaminase